MDRIDFFRQFHGISDEDYRLLEQKLRPRSFKKGELITVPGQVQRELYLVNAGVQMSYFESEHKTHVIAFTYAPGLCAIPESFFFQAPSSYYLVCLSDSTLEGLSYPDLQQLFDQSPGIERLFRKMTEAVLAGVISRHIELQAMNMEERYRAFGRRSPSLLQLVPHKYIASYLGIDPTNFSKLFNRIKI